MPTRRYRERLEELERLDRLRQAREMGIGRVDRPRRWTLEFLTLPWHGRAGMISLARLSTDPEVRTVIRLWGRLSFSKKRRTNLAQLCWACEIPESRFFGKVIEACFAHGADIAPLVKRLCRARDEQEAVLKRLSSEEKLRCGENLS